MKTKEEYDRRSDKDWNEERLREWEWKRNAGRDWEGRS